METTARSHRGAGRILAIIFGALLSLVALSLVLGSIALFSGQAIFGKDGFLVSPREELRTDTYALVSEPVDVEGIEDWSPGDDPVQVRISLDEGAEPMFVGVARADDVRAAFDGLAHATVTDFGDPGLGGVEYEVSEGSAPDGPPTTLLDWEAQASGDRELGVTWTPQDGSWVVVAMNADGSAGVSSDVRVGVHVPHLTSIAWTLLAVGIVLGLLAAALIAYGSGPHDRGLAGAAGVPAAAGATTAGAVTAAAGVPPYRSVRLEAIVQEPPSRWLWLVKWLLLIPHYVVLAFLFAAWVVCTVIAWFAIVITGRYPRGLFDFNVGVLRWAWRVNGYSYGALATDRYPPFTLGDRPDYPIRLEIDYPPRLSRALPFVKWVLAWPHLLLFAAASGSIVVGAVRQDDVRAVGVTAVLLLILAVGLLFTGRLPAGIFDLVVGMQRWMYRTIAYVGLLTDEYPPFRLDQGGEEPRRLDVSGLPPRPPVGTTLPATAEADRPAVTGGDDGGAVPRS